MSLRANALTNGGITTTVGLDDASDATNIEDMHYLLVTVEKMKRRMLGKTEGEFDESILEYRKQEGPSKDKSQIDDTSNVVILDSDAK